MKKWAVKGQGTTGDMEVIESIATVISVLPHLCDAGSNNIIANSRNRSWIGTLCQEYFRMLFALDFGHLVIDPWQTKQERAAAHQRKEECRTLL